MNELRQLPRPWKMNVEQYRRGWRAEIINPDGLMVHRTPPSNNRGVAILLATEWLGGADFRGPVLIECKAVDNG